MKLGPVTDCSPWNYWHSDDYGVDPVIWFLVASSEDGYSYVVRRQDGRREVGVYVDQATPYWKWKAVAAGREALVLDAITRSLEGLERHRV
jgi:hypothetical protein